MQIRKKKKWSRSPGGIRVEGVSCVSYVSNGPTLGSFLSGAFGGSFSDEYYSPGATHPRQT